jgi:hypothetical protein
MKSRCRFSDTCCPHCVRGRAQVDLFDLRVAALLDDLLGQPVEPIQREYAAGFAPPGLDTLCLNVARSATQDM